MKFEDMKVIWNAQNEEPLYAVNEQGLHDVLRQKSLKLKRLIFWQEAQTYGSSLFVIGVISALLFGYFAGFMDKLASRWDVLALFLAAGGWIYFGGRVFLARMQQRERQRSRDFTSSLRDELERDIRQLEFEIETRKRILLGFIPPYAGGLLFLWAYFRMQGAPEWMIIPFIVFMVGAMFWETRSQQRLVDRKLRPRKRELESLRDKLARADENGDPRTA